MTKQTITPGVPLRGAAKVACIPVKVVPAAEPLAEPAWLKLHVPNTAEAKRVRALSRKKSLYTVCEVASCPNLPVCFRHGTATFMIMGRVCTRPMIPNSRPPSGSFYVGITSPVQAHVSLEEAGR